MRTRSSTASTRTNTAARRPWLLLLRVKHGDIFNSKTLHKIQDITFDVNALPGVNHNEIFSLASFASTFTQGAVPARSISTSFMYPFVPTTQADIDDLKKVVDAIASRSPRSSTTTIRARWSPPASSRTSSITRRCSTASRTSSTSYQDDNTEIYVAGLPVVAGWGYYYLPRITLIFLCRSR